MDCQDVRERLPWWVNESLNPAERKELAGHLESCRGCRAELEETRAALAAFAHHLSIDVLIEVAAGRDPGVDQELLETHLTSCQACAEELALLRESREAVEESEAEEEPARPGKLLAWRRPRAPGSAAARWRGLAVAASLAAVVAGAVAVRGWLTASQLAVLDMAQLNVAVVDLYPSALVLRAGEAPEPPAPLPASSVRATLILNSRLPASTGPFDVEIRDADGRVLVEREGLFSGSDGLLTLSLATTELPAGELVLRLLRPHSDEVVERYSFQVR